MSKNQFTGTTTQPQRNRNFCKFNKDQYCTLEVRLTERQMKLCNLLDSFCFFHRGGVMPHTIAGNGTIQKARLYYDLAAL